MITYVALGDSITVGLGDPMPDGTWRGWARLLAESLGEQPGAVAFHNFATNGAKAAEVAGAQLDAALAVRPHVASVVVGVNDTLRNRFDLTAVGRALTAAVAALTSAGAVVLTSRLPDPSRMLGVPGVLARPLTRRMRAINAVTDALAERYGTVHFDADGHPEAYHRSMWSIDRLHPGERGHRLIAHSYAVMLAGRGVPVHRLPELDAVNPEPARLAQLGWLATRGTQWLIRRATDLVPDLAGLAAAEYWYRLRGLSAEPDRRIECEIAAALAALASLTRPAGSCPGLDDLLGTVRRGVPADPITELPG
jgi:lysophospholipase L1-like esterase